MARVSGSARSIRIMSGRMTSRDVQEVLSELFLRRGCPTHIRSDNGPEFIARALQAWYRVLTVAPWFIEPGSPWENGYVESFNGKLRDALLNGELFYTLYEAQVVIERWRRQDTRSVRTVRWGIGHRPRKWSHRGATSRRDCTQRVAYQLGAGQSPPRRHEQLIASSSLRLIQIRRGRPINIHVFYFCGQEATKQPNEECKRQPIQWLVPGKKPRRMSHSPEW